MDKRLFFMLNLAQKTLFDAADADCHEATGASVTQLAVLMQVKQQAGCRQQVLADALRLNKSAVTGMVNRLMAKGLLERRREAGDGRARQLFVTPAGLAVIEQAKPLIKQMNARFASAFSEAELQVVRRFLHFILEEYTT